VKIDNSLRKNAKNVIIKHRINPPMLLGSLPVSVSGERSAK